MNFDSMKHISIDGKKAVRLESAEGVVWKGLPQGYTQLDYIETTGEQYIDTGFVPNQDSRIVCEFMYFSGTGIFGARNTTSSDGFCLRVTSSKWQPQYNDTMKRTTTGADTENWHIADLDKNILYMDGAVGARFDYAEFTAPHSIGIGGIIANKNGVKSLYYGTGRYRNCRIYDNGVLVRDLMPCINAEGNIGMYDTLNAVFYGNAGSGVFGAGAADS